MKIEGSETSGRTFQPVTALAGPAAKFQFMNMGTLNRNLTLLPLISLRSRDLMNLASVSTFFLACHKQSRNDICLLFSLEAHFPC